MQASKRAAEPVTPQPAKKLKTDSGAKAPPASAPPKVADGKAADKKDKEGKKDGRKEDKTPGASPADGERACA